MKLFKLIKLLIVIIVVGGLFLLLTNKTFVYDTYKSDDVKEGIPISRFMYVRENNLDVTFYTFVSVEKLESAKDEYLKTLSVGEHTLKVDFSDNGEAITKFTIKGKEQNTNSEENKNTENSYLTNKDIQKDNTTLNPKTGDNIIVYFVLFTIAVSGIIILVIFNTKRKKNK